MAKVIIVAGVPASGKSWVCEQLGEKFEYVRHDDYIKHGKNHTKAYLHDIARMAEVSQKPILCETPFSISNLQHPLESDGHEVEVVVINEEPDILVSRYSMRPEDERGEGYNEGNFTRQKTYQTRALMNGWFMGTSSEVLEHLRAK